MRNFAYILICLFFVSCSVTKRRYQPGYFVESRHTPVPNAAAGLKAEQARIAPVSLPVIEAPPVVQKVFAAPGDSTRKKCDAIVYRDGTEDSVVVTEIGVSEIKYKKCRLQDGPLFVKKKAEVFMIKFSDGTREMIVAPPPEPVSPPAPRNMRPNTGLGITSFILALLGIFPLTFTGSILSLLYGVIYLKDTAGTDDEERRFAWAGIIIGTIVICLFLLLIFLSVL